MFLNAYIGRQPIFYKNTLLYGYDILHRINVTKQVDTFEDEDAVMRSVFCDTISLFDLKKLSGGLPLHFNFTKNLLLSNLPYILDPGQVVVEVRRNISVDDELIAKLAELKEAGYKLALSGYNINNYNLKYNKIIPFCDIIYINCRQHTRVQLGELRGMVRKYSNAKLLAEQVDTAEDFEKASSLSFTLYQGLYFGMPVCLREDVNLANTSYGRLYNELSKPSSNYDSCCKLIETDTVLTHMFCQETPVEKGRRCDVPPGIRAKLMYMGTGRLRKWSCLLLLKQIDVNDTQDIAKHAYQRGLFIEKLMENTKTRENSEEGFFLGVFSLLGEVSDTPVENLLMQLRLESGPRSAILGKEQNDFYHFLKFTEAFEETRTIPDGTPLRLLVKEDQIAAMLDESIREAEAAFQTINPYLDIPKKYQM